MISNGSRQTLLANIVQQGCASVLLLALPNVLSREDYAQVVFVGILLGFLVLADLGMSLVYCRLLPSIVVNGDIQKIKSWDATVSTLGIVLSAFFSIFIAFVFFEKFGSLFHALILSLLPIGLFWISFHVSRATVSGNFKEYRQSASARAVTSLVAIPLATIGGLTAWFWSQLLAVLLTIIYLGRKLLEPFGEIDWKIVRKHIPEGLMLCATTAAWLQLLNFGRLYAGFFYPADAMAHFGIAGAAYQSLSALLMSAFLPMTVGILGRMGKGDKEAFDFMASVFARSVWWVLAVSLLMSELSPLILRWMFPEYQFHQGTLVAFMLGIAFYPFFLLLGNCLVGKQRVSLYLALISAALGLSAGIATVCDSISAGEGAAWGQLAGLIFFSASLWGTTQYMFGHVARRVWRYIGKTLLKVVLVVICYAGLRVNMV